MVLRLVIASILLVNNAVFAEDGFVTCGSVVKLQHVETGYALNSESKNLGSGSGQQIVTFVDDPGSHWTLWTLRPSHHGNKDLEYPADSECQLAEPIPCNSMIRLTHTATYRNLHSHAVQSPLSRQQEVTAFGTGDGMGDMGDNWKVVCNDPAAKLWKQGDSIRLLHVDTNKYLGTAKNLEYNQNTCGMQCPIMGHLEAFGRTGVDSYSLLKVEQGVLISK